MTKEDGPRLEEALAAWGSAEFEATLREGIRALGVSGLPLQEGVVNGSYAVDSSLEVSVDRVWEEEGRLCVRAGLFYTSVIAGCACADDPTIDEERREYCVVHLDIDRPTGRVRVALVED